MSFSERNLAELFLHLRKKCVLRILRTSHLIDSYTARGIALNVEGGGARTSNLHASQTAGLLLRLSKNVGKKYPML